MKKVIATVVLFLSMVACVLMWFSGKFIPVYVNGEYVLVNQLMRYALYIIIVSVAMYCFCYLVTDDKPKKKHHRRRR